MTIVRNGWHACRAAAMLAVCAGGIAAAPAMAQITALPGTNEVADRARPGFDARGLPFGGFRLYPHVDIEAGYDDNIYNSDQLVIADRRVTLRGAASLRSNWSRNSLSLDASGSIERYDKTHAENSEQYRVGASGRYDISPVMNVDGDVHYLRATEPRGSAGDILIGGEPIVYRTGGGTVGAFAQAGRLSARANASFDHIDYSDARVGNVRISQNYRDHDAETLSGELGLLVSPAVTLYANGTYNRQRYDSRSAGFSLDADGYTALGGVGFEINRLISARASIGFQHQSFDDARFHAISGFTYDGSVRWNPTPLLSVDLTARKAIQQSPYLDISGIVTDSIAFSADYEFLRNLLVHAHLGYGVDDYQGVSRVDRRFDQGVGLRYLVNRYLEATLNYDHRRQASDRVFARRYDGNAVSLALRVQI